MRSWISWVVAYWQRWKNGAAKSLGVLRQWMLFFLAIISDTVENFILALHVVFFQLCFDDVETTGNKLFFKGCQTTEQILLKYIQYSCSSSWKWFSIHRLPWPQFVSSTTTSRWVKCILKFLRFVVAKMLSISKFRRPVCIAHVAPRKHRCFDSFAILEIWLSQRF